MAEPLKLGLVGTDLSHAVFFTELLQSPTLAAEYRIPGARVIALWTKGESAEERDRAAQLREEFGVGIQVDRPEDLIGTIDAALITATRGEDHRALAEPFIRARVPVFVDKPLADNLREARAIVALAQEKGTALASHSTLRYVTEVTTLAARVPSMGPLRSGICTGPGELFSYGIHTAEMLHAIFGPGVEWVQSIHDEEKDVAMVRYADGKTVGLHLMRFGAEAFECSYFAPNESGHIIVAFPTPFCLLYREMLQVVLEMFRTGRHPLALDHTLEVIAILEAMRRSAEEGSRIYLAELMAQEPGDMTNDS